MNKHQIDRLFEEKLANHAQEPSAKAQARFEELLAKKHKKPVVIWWQVAAAVTLLAVSTFAYLNWTGEEQLIADLPENTPQVTEGTSTPAEAIDEVNDEPVSAESIDEEVVESINVEPMLAEANDSGSVEAAIDDESRAAIDQAPIINTPSTAIALAEEDETPDETGLEEEILPTGIEEIAQDNIAVAVNETPEAAPVKKRLPVTIIYKAAGADASLIAMEEIRGDVDSLASERDNSLMSILQNSGDRSLLAELRKAKQDLFNLDFQTKSKKANN